MVCTSVPSVLAVPETVRLFRLQLRRLYFRNKLLSGTELRLPAFRFGICLERDVGLYCPSYINSSNYIRHFRISIMHLACSRSPPPQKTCIGNVINFLFYDCDVQGGPTRCIMGNAQMAKENSKSVLHEFTVDSDSVVVVVRDDGTTRSTHKKPKEDTFGQNDEDWMVYRSIVSLEFV